MQPLKLLISTPVQPIPRGHGFYQIEEQSLFVQLGGQFDSNRFYSFIDSPLSRFDVDRRGRLLFFEINQARHKWQVVENLSVPEIIEPADIRWLDFRRAIDSPEVLTNKSQSIVKLKFSDVTPHYNYYLAESVILQVDKFQNAVAVIVSDILDDTAGQRIAAFRKELYGQKLPESCSHHNTITAPLS